LSRADLHAGGANARLGGERKIGLKYARALGKKFGVDVGNAKGRNAKGHTRDTRAYGRNERKDTLSVGLRDGRTITVPIAWYPRLLNATPAQRKNWRVAGGGYGIHWPELDEDLSTEGLLRGAPASRASQAKVHSDAGRSSRRST